MSRFIPMRAEKVREDIRQVLERAGAGFEDLPEFFKALARSPAALKAYVLADEALSNGNLSPRYRCQIALVVSEINGSGYDVARQADAARAVGLAEHDVELALRARATDAKVGGLLTFVQALVVQRGEITDADFEELRQAGFADEEIVEIVANVALHIFTNYLNLVAATAPPRRCQIASCI